MQTFQHFTLPIFSVSLLLGACSNGNSSNESTVSDMEPIVFNELAPSFAVPVAELVDGTQMASGISNGAGLVYLLSNNQQVIALTEEAEVVEVLQFPMLGSVSAQAISVEDEDERLAILDSQGQLYLQSSGEQALDVTSYNYPETPDFACLAPGENGDWVTVNRTGAKTLYTLLPDGSINSMALDSRLTEYNIVGADVDVSDDGDEQRLFLLASFKGQERTSSIFQVDALGQVTDAWSFSIDEELEPTGLNVVDPETAEFVIANGDSMATVTVWEMPGTSEVDD